MKFLKAVFISLLFAFLVGCGGGGGSGDGGSGGVQGGTYGSGVRLFFGFVQLLEEKVEGYRVFVTLEQTGERVEVVSSRYRLETMDGVVGESVLRFEGSDGVSSFDTTVRLATDEIQFEMAYAVEADVSISVEENRADVDKVEVYGPDEKEIADEKSRQPGKKQKQQDQQNDEAIDSIVQGSGGSSSNESERPKNQKGSDDEPQIGAVSESKNEVGTAIEEEGILF